MTKKAPHETQRGFAVHSAESAPDSVQDVMAWYQENFQMVPHLAGVMADAPALVRSYWQIQDNLTKLGTLTPAENNVVQMAIAVENKCQYCVAGHTMAGSVFFGNSEEEIAALRTEGKLPEAKLNALRTFALAVNDSHGRVSERQLNAFLAAGYTRQQALDVVTNIAAKVLTNYTNQLAETPVDEAFKPLTAGLPYKENRRLIGR